jgi:glycosyltransferase involved in cell wall biosynthesis
MTDQGQPFRQSLPDLDAYRRELAAEGAVLPLPAVPLTSAGLLRALPAPPAGRRGWPWDRETPVPPGPVDAWPAITVVMPSFQQGQYLEEAIRSVLLQNYPKLEFIVMDGGSTDGSAGIIERYRPWISFARVAPDRGQSHAINLGLSLGSGEIEGWLNSDDFYLPGALARVARIRLRTHAEFIYGDALALDDEAGRRRFEPAGCALGRFVRFPGLVISHAAFWVSAGRQPLWEEQHCALDYELWIRLLPGLRCAHIRWPLGVGRAHAEAKSQSRDWKPRWGEDARRNALAHPELYRAGLGQRWLRFQFRLAQGWCRRWRRLGFAARLEQTRRECGWNSVFVADD